MPRSNCRRTVLRGVLAVVLLNAVAQILLKAARAARPEVSVLSLFLEPATWTAFIVYGLSAACWLSVLSRAQLSLAYPLLSLTFPIVVILSAFLFSESISAIRWVGVGIIFVGVSLLSTT